MPVYDYKCANHGLFFELATFEQSAAPCPCPTCGNLSPRIVLLAPELLLMPQAKRQAIATNEKAQHAPEYSTAARREADHQHKTGCGCQHKKSSKLMYTAQGEKMFPSMRPWMISH